MPLPQLDQWRVQTMRATLFSPGAVTDEEFFARVTGANPEMQQRNPNTGQRMEGGIINGKRLDFHWSINRLDMLLAPGGAPGGDNQLPSVGDFETSSHELADLFERWVGVVQCPVNRIALGVSSAITVPSIADANRLLQEHVGTMTFDADILRDVVVQLNRPTSSSTLPELAINRIGKWSAVPVTYFQITLNQGAQSFSPREIPTLQLETDINTSPNHAEALSTEQITALVREMQQMTSDLVQNGSRA